MTTTAGIERKSLTADEAIAVLDDAISEVSALQDEDRPDADMLAEMRADVAMIADGDYADNVLSVARTLLEEIDALLAKADMGVPANDKATAADIERKAAGVDLSELDKMAAEIDRAVAQYDALAGLITDDLNAEPSDPAEIAALIERLKSYIPMVQPYRDFIVNASSAVDALSDDATTRITAAVDDMQDKISQIDGAEYAQPEDLQFDIEIRIQELETGEKSGKISVARKSAPSTAAARLAAMADLLPDLIADAADPALDAETKAEVRTALAAQSAALGRMAREAIAAGHDALATEIVAARAGLPVAA